MLIETLTTENNHTINVYSDDEYHERDHEAGRLVFCNYPGLAYENDNVGPVIRKDAILVPLYLFKHSSYAIRAAQCDALNVDGPVRANAIQMIQEGLGRRHSGCVDDPYAVLDAVRGNNPFHCRFDSGLAGFAIFNRSELVKDTDIDALIQTANGELETIQHNMNGEWFSVEVELDDEEVYACAGFNTPGTALEDGKAVARADSLQSA